MTDAEFSNYNHYEPFVWDDPVNHIEPEVAPFQLRDARLMTVHMLNDFAAEILQALTGENPLRGALIQLYGIAYGMGLSTCGDVSMSDRSDKIGCERGSLSKVAVAWNTAHDLPPSLHQKSCEANENYAATRRAVVQSNGHKRSRPFPHRGPAKRFKPMPPLPR